MSFDVHVGGKDRQARAFSVPRLVEHPPPVGAQLCYLFPFSLPGHGGAFYAIESRVQWRSSPTNWPRLRHKFVG